MNLNQIAITMFVSNQIDKLADFTILKLELDETFMAYPAIELRLQKINTNKAIVVYYYPVDTSFLSLESSLKGNNCLIISFCEIDGNDLLFEKQHVSFSCQIEHSEKTDVSMYMPTNYHIVNMPILTIRKSFELVLPFLKNCDIMHDASSNWRDFINEYKWL